MTGGGFDREQDVLQEAGRAGAVALFCKPLHLEELLEVVAGVVALPR
jgi:hypothetical protein